MTKLHDETQIVRLKRLDDLAYTLVSTESCVMTRDREFVSTFLRMDNAIKVGIHWAALDPGELGDLNSLPVRWIEYEPWMREKLKFLVDEFVLGNAFLFLQGEALWALNREREDSR